MTVDKRMVRAFLLWLLFMVLLTVFQHRYYSLDRHFVQVGLLQSVLALLIIFLILRAAKIGRNFATIIAFCWFLGVYTYFGLIARNLDMRLRVLLLVAIAIALNIALTLVLRRRAPR